MTGKNFLFLIVGLVAAGALIYFLYPGIRSTDGNCKLCAEEIHEGMGYTVTLTDGSKIKTCCPTCGLHLQIHDPQKIASAYATDYASGKAIEAAQAFYVERMMRNEMGGVNMMDWHRCDPSLVAFGSREVASVFQAQHGGRIMSFDEAENAVRAH